MNKKYQIQNKCDELWLKYYNLYHHNFPISVNKQRKINQCLTFINKMYNNA